MKNNFGILKSFKEIFDMKMKLNESRLRIKY